MPKRPLPLVAVDISLLASNTGGLSRYVRQLLPVVMRQSVGHCHWALYGRNGNHLTPDMLTQVNVRLDLWPADLGRILGLFSTLPWWARQDSPDVFWGPAHRLPAWLPGDTAKVVTIHDLCWKMAPETMRPVTRWLEAALMPQALAVADRVIAVSIATQNALAQYFPEHRHKVSVVNEGASPLPGAGPVEELWRLGVRQPYVLFVGTHEPRKNLVRLVEAFAQIVHRTGAATTGVTRPQLVLVGGSGWGNAKMNVRIGELGLNEHVLSLGLVPDALLSTLYHHARCLAMPSLIEGFGLPLVEAMAQGTPVVTSHGSSMPEVAGLAGVLVDPMSVDSIALGIGRMLDHPDERSRLALQAVNQAAQFTWERAGEETLKILLDACADRNPGA